MKNATHLIDIKGIVEMLGPSKAKSFTALHALSGFDTTGRFINIGKKTWIDLFLNLNQSIDEALLTLESENPLSHVKQLEEFVCRLYSSKKHMRGHSKSCHQPSGGGGSSKIVTNSDKEGRGVNPNRDVTAYEKHL